MRQSTSDQAPLRVGACRKQMPRQRSPGSVWRAKPLRDQEGETAGAGKTSRHCRSYTCEKGGGGKQGWLGMAAACSASLEQVPASLAGPLAQRLPAKEQALGRND